MKYCWTILLAACASEAPAPATTSRAGECLGEPSSNPAVVLVHGRDYRCTGVVISARHVATAGHCLRDEEPAMQVEIGGRRRAARALWAWGPDGEDIGVLELEAAQSEVEPVVLAGFSPEPLEPLTLTGYGCTGSQVSRPTHRRWGRYAETTEFAGSGCTCPGDSGAPVFNAADELVAINWTAGGPLLVDAALLQRSAGEHSVVVQSP